MRGGTMLQGPSALRGRMKAEEQTESKLGKNFVFFFFFKVCISSSWSSWTYFFHFHVMHV